MESLLAFAAWLTIHRRSINVPLGLAATNRAILDFRDFLAEHRHSLYMRYSSSSAVVVRDVFQPSGGSPNQGTQSGFVVDRIGNSIRRRGTRRSKMLEASELLRMVLPFCPLRVAAAFCAGSYHDALSGDFSTTASPNPRKESVCLLLVRNLF